jgi:CubicO group peptidase (beta-lactamase class C family)
MKKTFLLPIALFALVSTLAQRPAKCETAGARRSAQSQQPGDEGSAARIARIENDLPPAVVIKGQAVRAMTLRERMQFYKVPGVSVAFFDHGKIIWTRAYGLADVATKKPVTPETLFQAASIGKPLSALAVLHLVEEGKLSLDENVNDKLRTWKVPDNQFTTQEKVTLRRILSHSAGLNFQGLPGYVSGEPVPTIVQILNGEKPANIDPIRVDVVPGTIWRYSNGGYIVLQTLMGDVTGKPFPEIMNDLVLRPAGMTHSNYEQPLGKNLWPLAATPYDESGEPVKGGWHTYPELGPAGLWTTPSDLARFAIEVQNEYAGRSTKILSQQIVREMLTREKDDWGLGFALPPGHKLRFAHGGQNAGYRCDLEAYADMGPGLAVMTNSDGGEFLIQELLRAVAKEYSWPDLQPVEHTLAKVDPALLRAYVGIYEDPNAGKITVSMKNNSLYTLADPLGPEPQELYPESNTDFFILSNDVTVSFQRDAKGKVSKMIVHAFGHSFEVKKIVGAPH